MVQGDDTPQPSSTPGIGLPNQRDFSGPWLSQQLILTLSFGVLSVLSFSALVKRRTWRSYLAPIGRGPLLAEGEESSQPEEEYKLDDGKDTRLGRFLSAIGMEWLATTLYTSDVATAHLSGPPTSSIDTLTLLNFFRFGAKLFAVISLWSCLVLMPVNWRENGWLDGVNPGDDDKGKEQQQSITQATMLFFLRKGTSDRNPPEPLPIPPGGPTGPDLSATTLYDSAHLVTLYFVTGALMWLLTTQTAAFLLHRQRILHGLHDSLASRSILIRSLPTNFRSAEALRNYFGDSLELSATNAWVLPDVGMGVRKLLQERERALRKFEQAWVAWVGNPVKPEFKSEWEPSLIEERVRERSRRVATGEETLPSRGWFAGASRSGNVSDEQSTLLGSSPDLSDPSWGPPSFIDRRPTRRLHFFSTSKVDLLADLEIEFLKLDVAVIAIRQKMLSGEWKSIGVGFVEFKKVKDALIAAQTLFFEQHGMCRSVMAPDGRDVIWRNIGIPANERRLRQLLISIALTLLYAFYLPPLLFLGSLLSPGFLGKYLPGLYKLLTASPRLEALVVTQLPSLVLVIFNACLPLLLEQTAVWQGVKTKSGVEISTLKKYHIFLVTSVIFIFIITGTAFGVLLDLSANPMRILDKLSLSLPLARNFSLSYVILQSFTVLPFQLLSIFNVLTTPIYNLAAKTPREYAEASPAPIFKAGTAYPQALIVATLGLVYCVVKPLVTIFALFYFLIGYVVYKYKLLFVFYPPPSSTQTCLTSILRPRLIFAVFLFQVFQLSLFSVHGQVLCVLLTLPLMGTTVWYGHFLTKRFEALEKYECLEGAIRADALGGEYQDELEDTAADEAPSGAQTPATPPTDRWPAEVDAWNDNRGDNQSGTSTPSTIEPSKKSEPSTKMSRQKRIWASFPRLKRTRSNSIDQQGRGRKNSLSNLTYHRPESKFTNYREMRDESGIDSLPGIVEERSSRFSTLSGPRSLPEAADVEGGSTLLVREEQDARRRERAAIEGGGEVVGEEGEMFLDSAAKETYEHPAIRGRLKDFWLPSR